MKLLLALILAVCSFSVAAQGRPINCPDTGGNHLNFLTATNRWVCGTSSAGGAAALSSITAATAANSINNGDFAQTWNWALTTAAKSAFLFTENTASINGVGSQYLVDIKTLAASTAAPIRISAQAGLDNLVISNNGTIDITGSTTASGTGRAITISAGGSSSGQGGTLRLRAGFPLDGNGGVVFLEARDGTGTNKNGGDITVTAGNSTGSGITGNITFQTTTANILRVNGTSKHFSIMGTAPTMGACGTSPTVTGKDQGMLITIGTGGVATSCAVTFANAFTNAPICVAQSDTDLTALQMVTTTTTATISKATAFTASSKLHVVCMSYE